MGIVVTIQKDPEFRLDPEAPHTVCPRLLSLIPQMHAHTYTHTHTHTRKKKIQVNPLPHPPDSSSSVPAFSDREDVQNSEQEEPLPLLHHWNLLPIRLFHHWKTQVRYPLLHHWKTLLLSPHLRNRGR